MKFLALLLSVIVLTLTAAPCCAFEKNETHVHKAYSEEKHDKCPDPDDDCCKNCSPFYVCGTCIGFTINNLSVLTFTLHLKPIQHNYIYIPVKLRQMPYSIWQPPKLS
ncbi:DUF6660 family protein [Pedobacter foliorum]|uniref:DUF6660 family protein n=1 Tax=Pedobacter foliorum TaxID=2739058 RepID=UPI003743DB31